MSGEPFEKDGQWYFWVEDETAACGPYISREEANERLATYCKQLDDIKYIDRWYMNK